MTQQEKIEAIEELFEADAGAIAPGTALDTLQWDSMAMLSLIALAKARCGKRLTGDQLRGFKTVQDVLNELE